MDDLDWIDLPDDSYKAILGYETQNISSLDELIKKYNKIPKDQITTLSCRIRKLNQIVDLIADWTANRLEEIDKKKHLVWTLEIAAKKRNYLEKLQKIYVDKLHEDAPQKCYHTATDDLYNRKHIPIVLNNQRFFSLKMREFWGDFWLESLDPCHRRLTPFLDQWEKASKSNPDTPHFFLWLETQHLPKYIPRVKYLSGDALEKTRVAINNGLFWEKSDSEWSLANFNNPSHRFLFAINLVGNLYVANESTGVSHSSFTCGKPVLGAGLIQTEEGRLKSIALESGHYMPSVEIGYQILKIFEEKGVSFPEKLEVDFFHDRNKYKAEVSTTPLPSFKEFQETLKQSSTNKLKGCHERQAI